MEISFKSIQLNFSKVKLPSPFQKWFTYVSKYKKNDMKPFSYLSIIRVTGFLFVFALGMHCKKDNISTNPSQQRELYGIHTRFPFHPDNYRETTQRGKNNN